MENEKLSRSFIQKYDPLTDSFVVVQNQTNENNSQEKRRFEPFSFFKFKNRTRTMQDENLNSLDPSQQPLIQPTPEQDNSNNTQYPTLNPTPVQNTPHIQPTRPKPPQPPMPPRPQPVPPQNTPVILARDAYNRMRILSSFYQSMAVSDPSNAETYNSLAGEMLILETTMLSIYQLLSGNNFVPTQTMRTPTLTGNICTDLSTIQSFLQDTVDNVISLQRSVNISNVDRQLAIINATLLSQSNKLSTLQSSCAGVNNEQ